MSGSPVPSINGRIVCTSVYGGGGPAIRGVTVVGVQRKNVDHHQPVFTASLTETSGRCGDRGAGRGWVADATRDIGGGGGGGGPAPSQPVDVSFLDFSVDRVNENLDYNTLDVFPVFPVLPRADGYVPWVSPVSMPDSPADQTLGSLLDEMTGLYSSILGSPVISRSSTSRAEDVHLLSVPLIPLPVEESPDVEPERKPTPEVVPPPMAFSREGPFAVATATVTNGDQPPIAIGLSRCPYRITTYRDQDIACVDSSFGCRCTTLGFWRVCEPRSQPGCWVILRPNGLK